MKRTILAGLVIVLSGSLSTGVYALAPAVQQYQGVQYLTGGVGAGEREQILAQSRDFNLKLEFAEKGGAYLSAVGVVVADAQGKPVLELRSDGPLVLAKLPPGTYRIAVTANGREQTRTASVPATGMHSTTFYW